MPTLKPGKYAEEHVAQAIQGRFGEALADSLALTDAHARHLYGTTATSLAASEAQIKRKLVAHPPWDRLAASHLRVLHAIYDTEIVSDALQIFDLQKSLVSIYNEWFRNDNTAWSLPVLYVIHRDLRQLATRADEELIAKGLKPAKLAEATRAISTGFGLCCSDRSSTGDSKKIGVLYMASLLFKIYFKLKSTALCKNVIRGVENAGLVADFQVPIAHQVTYRYYMGVLSFLQEDYEKAEEHLSFAFDNCHRNQHRNREMMMNYLVPLRLLKGKRPVAELLNRFKQLSIIYPPFITAVKLGDVEMFDKHLMAVEKQLMKRGTYLIVERCREVCLCNFVKLIYRLKSPAHQIPLSAFGRMAYNEADGGDQMEESERLDEVECLLANLIAQDRVRGYIHHQARRLVLSKLDGFPSQQTKTMRGN